MKEKKIKLMIIALTLFVVFDPSVEKLRDYKSYFHDLFYSTFEDRDISTVNIQRGNAADDSASRSIKKDSSQNILSYLDK